MKNKGLPRQYFYGKPLKACELRNFAPAKKQVGEYWGKRESAYGVLWS
ncbi:hypothetical protein TRIP_C90356 [Candidatus Zixiibacteriota bacterium]|nr:hypothetical protein TRIP_C90356 [candidate division Zixibacteria bacterium]